MANNKIFNAGKAKAIMNDLSMTQHELARSIGVSTSTVSNWMKGKAQPSSDVVSQMAEEFGCDADELTSDNPGVVINGSHSVVYIISITNQGTIHFNVPEQNQDGIKEIDGDEIQN